MTKISVLIPNYNKGSFVSETLRSALEQTHENLEVVFCDDGSTDGSMECAQAIARQDDRVTILRNETSNRNASVCRNLALEASSGEYVVYLDSDDLLRKTALEVRLREIRKLDCDFMVFSMGTFYQRIGDRKRVWLPEKNKALERFLQHRMPWSIMSPIFRRDFVERLGGHDESFVRLQDVEFHTGCLLTPGVNFGVSKQRSPDCFYRVSQERSGVPAESQLDDFISGVRCYVTKFEPILAPTQQKSLRLTLFAALDRVVSAQRAGLISQERGDYLWSNLVAMPIMDGAFGLRRNLVRLHRRIAHYRQISGVNYSLRVLLRQI